VSAAPGPSLPAAITGYLAAAAESDTGAVVTCFTPDGLVVDEDREWRGAEGIRRWRETVATAYRYTVEVTGATAVDPAEGGETYLVGTHLEGNFPGGAVDLSYRFTLRGGRIARLEIGPVRVAP
jgi:hypothetical protein